MLDFISFDGATGISSSLLEVCLRFYTTTSVSNFLLLEITVYKRHTGELMLDKFGELSRRMTGEQRWENVLAFEPTMLRIGLKKCQKQ